MDTEDPNLRGRNQCGGPVPLRPWSGDDQLWGWMRLRWKLQGPGNFCASPTLLRD